MPTPLPVDLTELPIVRKDLSTDISRVFRNNHPYHRLKEELRKLSPKERAAVDLLQMFRVWGTNVNREVARVIRLNADYYIPICSSLATKIYHPEKNRWIIFALLAGITVIARFEPVKLTDEMFDLLNKGLVDRRKPIRRQALSVVYAAMYPVFGIESSVKPIFRKKILRDNLKFALNSNIQEVMEANEGYSADVSLATKFNLGLMEAGSMSGGMRTPYSGEEILQTFERWFGLRRKKDKGLRK